MEKSSPTETEQDNYTLAKPKLKPHIVGWIRNQAHRVINNEKTNKQSLERDSAEAREIAKIHHKRAKKSIEGDRKKILNDIINEVQQTDFNSSSKILSTFDNIKFKFRGWQMNVYGGRGTGGGADPEFTPRPKKIVALRLSPK